MSPRLSAGYIFYDRIVSFQNLWKIPLQEKQTGPVFLFCTGKNVYIYVLLFKCVVIILYACSTC